MRQSLHQCHHLVFLHLFVGHQILIIVHDSDKTGRMYADNPLNIISLVYYLPVLVYENCVYIQGLLLVLRLRISQGYCGTNYYLQHDLVLFM